MSEYAIRSLAPRIFMCAIFSFLFLTNAVHAQVECGSIINTPVGSIPIENCSNPFNADEDFPLATTIFVNRQEVVEGGIVTVSSDELRIPVSFSLEDTDLHSLGMQIFFHEDENYAWVGGSAPDNPDAENTITLSESGTYSAVIVLTDGSVGENPQPVFMDRVFDRIIRFILPRAYAFFPDEVFVKEVTFRIEIKEAEQPTSVLFLPGIKASRLYTDGILGTEDRIWEPFPNPDVQQLEMTEEGESLNQIYTRDVIDEALGFVNIYVGLLQYTQEQVQQDNIGGWESFAYDWRYDVLDIVENGTQYENERMYPVDAVEELAAENDGKVTIVAHSNGGLLAKALLEKLESEDKADLVERVVFLASPQIGTPKSIGSILHGYGEEILGGLIVNDETAREVIRNMPGAYGLLPALAYFDAVSDPVVSFDNSDLAEEFVDAYGSTIDSLSELTDFMNGAEGRDDAETIEDPSRSNADMLAEASAYHNNLLDDWEAPEGVEVIEIVGTGLDTVDGFRYEEFTREECFFGRFGCRDVSYLKPVPHFTTDGDGTVVAASAEAYDGEKTTYYIDLGGDDTDVTHADIAESEHTQALLTAILSGESVDVPYVSETHSTYEDSERDMVSVHSPVSIAITDENGNGVRVEDGQVINEIPGSTYMEFAGGKYIIVPSDTEYTVDMHGENDGDYTVRIDKLYGDETEKVFTHSGTTNEDMEITFEKTEGEYTPLVIDENGDGEADETVQIEEGDSESEMYTYGDLENAIENLDLRRGRKVALLARVRLAERMSEHGGHWIFSRIEERTLENLERTLDRYVRREYITEEELAELSGIIGVLKTSS